MSCGVPPQLRVMPRLRTAGASASSAEGAGGLCATHLRRGLVGSVEGGRQHRGIVVLRGLGADGDLPLHMRAMVRQRSVSDNGAWGAGDLQAEIQRC